MARIKVEISKSELEAIIHDLETNNGAYKNRSALHEAVANTDWAKNFQPKPITPSVVALRIEEFGIEPLTPKGKRGRSEGFVAPKYDGEKRRQNKEAILSNPRAIEIYDRLIDAAPAVLHKTIERARRGSVRSAIKAQCCHCVGFENMAANIRGCSATLCALYPYRPYQTVSVNGQEIEDDEGDE